MDHGFRAGLIEAVPLGVAAGLFGFAFGLVAAQDGWPWWGIGLMSATAFAGTSQVAAVDRLAAGEAALGAVLAGAALNLRYLAMMATLAPVLRDVPPLRRLAAIHLTADANWALVLARRARDPRVGFAFLLGSGLTMAVFWIGSTAAGAAFGPLIGNPQAFGLGFALTAAFAGMARGLWRGRRDALPLAAAVLLGAGLTRAGVPGAYATVIAALGCAGVHALLRRLA